MEDTKKILDTVAKALPITYVLGFLIINGHLSNYGFSDYNILNATYLKAGVLFAILFAFIFMAVYFAHGKEKPTDDLRKSWPILVVSIYNLSILSVILLTQLINPTVLFKEKTYLVFIFVISMMLHALMRFWADGKIARFNLGVVVLNILPLLFLLPVIIIFAINYNTALMILIFIFGLGQTTWVSLGLFGDRSYNERLFTDVFILILACFFFGKALYEKIPYKFGGGQPYEIICKNSSDTLINKNAPTSDTLLVLYENDDRLLLKNKKGEIMFTQKSELNTYYIRQK